MKKALMALVVIAVLVIMSGSCGVDMPCVDCLDRGGTCVFHQDGTFDRCDVKGD